MKAIIPMACALALGSCNADGPAGSSAGEAEVVEGEAPDLSGHYRVDTPGDDLLDFPLEVSANVNSIWWEPSCSGQGLSYRAVADGRVEFFDPRDPDEPQIVCDIGYPDGLPKFWDALAGVRDVELRKDRSFAITVDGKVWEFEPTTDPLPADLAGTWRVEEINGLSMQEMRYVNFQADDSEIWWEPRCAGYVLTYTLDDNRFAVTEPPYEPPPPPNEGEVAPPPKPVCAVGLPPHLADAAKALEASEEIARDNRNNLVFAGPQSRVVLSRIDKSSE